MLPERIIYILLGFNDRQGRERPLLWHPAVIIGALCYLIIAVVKALAKGINKWAKDIDSTNWRILP